MDSFQLTEAAALFLLRQRLPLRVTSICKMAESLRRGRGSFPIDFDTIRFIVSVAPQVFEFVYTPQGSVDSLLGVTSLSSSSSSSPSSSSSVFPTPSLASGSMESTQNGSGEKEDKVDSFQVGGVTYLLEIRYKKKFGGTGEKAQKKRREAFLAALRQHQGLDKKKGIQTDKERDEKDLRTLVPLAPLPPKPWLAQPSPSSSFTPSSSPSPSPPVVSPAFQNDPLMSRFSENTSDSIVEYLKQCPFYESQMIHEEDFPSRESRYSDLKTDFSAPLKETLLESFGVKRLFLHQVTAIEAVREGKDVVVATSTSSGKSLIFNLPVFESMLTCEKQSGVKALYIFPTKALAQDQLAKARRLGQAIQAKTGKQIRINTFDGDTVQGERDMIRLQTDIIITNPDMLHVSVLPYHSQWKGFLGGLKFVVIDEAHTYHGAFGSHVACVLKRLLRVAQLYADNQPQFLSCSATIGNPLALFKNLVSGSVNQVQVIGEEIDGSPCGRRKFVIWRTPFVQNGQGSLEDSEKVVVTASVKERKKINNKRKQEEPKLFADKEATAENGPQGADSQERRRKSSIYETALLLSALVRRGVKTMAFCRTRKLTELVLRYTHDELKHGFHGKVYKKPSVQDEDRILQEFQRARPDLAELVAGYRGGYQVDERRVVEEQLFTGKLLAVTATNALELGIDVGHLDAVILLGYPGSSASMWQQVGRAGRSGKDALAIMVCFDGPVDQFFALHPQVLLDRSRVENAVLDPLNKYVLKEHLLCALKEHPMVISNHPASSNQDLERFAGQEAASLLPVDPSVTLSRTLSPVEKVKSTILQLVADGLVEEQSFGDSDVKIYSTHPKLDKPSANVSLRVIDPVSFELYHGDQLMDSIPYSRAFFELYPGAIYMHQGKSYLVSKIDLDHYKAYAHPTKAAYFTAPRDVTSVCVKDRFESRREGPNLFVNCGAVEVVASVWGYRKMWLRSGRVFEMHEFTLPPIQFETQGVWVDLSTEIQDNITRNGLDLRGGIHAANHLLKKLVSLFVICHQQNINTVHVGKYFKRPQPARLILYDNCPGGLGAAESAFSHVLDLLWRAFKLVSECPCTAVDGCPSCVNDFSCGENNAVLDKQAAKQILEALLQGIENPVSSSGVVSNKRKRLVNTPQKKRAKAVDRAMGMGRARVERMQIKPQWTAQHPNYSEGMKEH